MSQSTDQRSLSVSRRRQSAHLASSAKLLGNWQLDEIAADGAMTCVYFGRPLGCPPSRPSDYAIKALKPAYVSDPLAIDVLRREAEVGRQTSHANLVPILEACLQDTTPHVIMPRLDGAPLIDVVEYCRGLVVSQSLWFTRQIAQALHHIHSRGWIHGDVKPANVVVSRDGHATLIDLGSALKPNESIYSRERILVGTLHYMAPEMLTSTSQTSPSCDVYSLGVTLFQLLTGQLPFDANHPAQLVQAHLREIPPRVNRLRPDVPTGVVELVSRMLAKSPMRRPTSAAELIDELTELEIETLDRRMCG